MSKVLLTIGAGPGISAATARKFGANGYKVAQVRLEDDKGNANGCGVRLPDDETCTVGRSCADISIQDSLAGDGEYIIDPDGTGPVLPLLVYCDIEVGSAWTLFYSFSLEDETVSTVQIHTPPSTITTTVTRSVTSSIPFTDFPADGDLRDSCTAKDPSAITCAQPADGATARPDNTEHCVFAADPLGGTQGSCGLTSQADCTAALASDTDGTECGPCKTAQTNMLRLSAGKMTMQWRKASTAALQCRCVSHR